MAFKRPEDGWRFNFGGIKTNAAADELPPGKYPYAQNVRQTASVQTRPGYDFFFATGIVITTTCPLPTGEVSIVYSDTLAAVGGVTPYTWTLATGSMPTGLSMSTAGVITGTPSVAGTFNFTLRVTDAHGLTDTKSCSMTIAAAPVVTTACPLPDGDIGVFYSQGFANSGGVGPFVWTLDSGSLPTGLTLSSDGTVSGTPTIAAVSTFTVRVTDSLGGTATKSCQITVSNPNNAIIFTDHFDIGYTSPNFDNMGPMWTVSVEFPLAANRNGIAVGGGVAQFFYVAGNGQGLIGGFADVATYGVAGIHALLGTADVLSEGTLNSDSSNPAIPLLTYGGPAVCMGGTAIGHALEGYVFIYATPVTGVGQIYRFNGVSGSTLMTGTVPAAVGQRFTLTAEDVTGTGSTIRLRAYLDGVQVLTVDDSSASRLQPSGAKGLYVRFCSSGVGGHWDDWVCAIPNP